jgi:lipoprotein-releasing system ATP-binding protein
MGEDGEPLLLLEGVRRSFGEKVVTEVLHGIDLRLDHGEFTALIGPSGSGKSTLLHLLGLLDRPTAGRIVLAGRDVSELSEEERTELRGRTLGFIFQFHHLLPEFTAEENVFMPMLAVRGREEPAMRQRARTLLTAIGLADRMAYRVTDLSGGQQQRVAIARALAMSPPLVLADEPTGNLDTETGDQVFALLRRFNQEDGTAFLIVTHDPRIAERCDRVIDLVDGRIHSDRRASAP